MRHAETEWNRQKRIQGHSDSPLTTKGKAAAGLWGAMFSTLHFNRIITSDLGRAKETSKTVNRYLKLPIIEESNLREQYWGQWEGLPVTQVEAEESFVSQISSGWNFRPLCGESRHEVRQRSRTALIETGQKWPGESILVVTHESLIRCLVNALSGQQFLPGEPRIIKSKHLHWLIYKNGMLEIEKLNAIEL